MQIRYFILGKGAPILFLHGAGTYIVVYKELLNLLAENYLVIAVDIPCFGNSSVPKKIWNISDYGDYFSGFINELKYKNITIIGHSLGGAIGASVALKNKKVTKLVLVDNEGLSNGKNWFSLYYSYFVIQIFNDIFRYKQIAKTMQFVKYYCMNVITHFTHVFQIFRIMNNCLSQKTIPFHRIKAKCLIVWGNDDRIFPVEDAKKLYTTIPGSSLQIVDGNHDWCLFHPEKLNSIVKEFLNKACSPR